MGTRGSAPGRGSAAAQGGVGQRRRREPASSAAELVPGGTISSIASSRSSSSTTSAAPQLASSCSMVRGPMIADVTAGWLMHEGHRQVRSGQPGLLGEPWPARRPRRACAGSSGRTGRSGRRCRSPRRRVRRHPGPCGTGPSASRRRAGSRRSRPCRALADRQHVGARSRGRASSTAAARRRSARAAPLGRPLRLDDLVTAGRSSCRSSGSCPGARRSVSAPSVSSMSVSRIGTVDLVQVDVVGLQPAQAVLDLAHDPAPRVAPLVRVVAHRAVDLGGEHDVVAPAPAAPCRRSPRTRPREYTSAVSTKLMPASSARVDDADRVVVVAVAPGAEHHGAEAERADLDAGATERAHLHALTVPPAAGRSKRRCSHSRRDRPGRQPADEFCVLARSDPASTNFLRSIRAAAAEGAELLRLE